MNKPKPFYIVVDKYGNVCENFPENSEIDWMIRLVFVREKKYPSAAPLTLLKVYDIVAEEVK